MDSEVETVPQSPRDQLRDRLLEMREQLIDRLAAKINGGDLALLGSVAAALATTLNHNVYA
jgi:hypothetical protein